MPLGNYTSQFFANVYLTRLDYFVKHKLKIKFYIRYVDDFIILHNSKRQLEIWKKQIDNFLQIELKLVLHPQKSKIIPLCKGVDFVGFRDFGFHKLLRKRNIWKMAEKIKMCGKSMVPLQNLMEIYQGWQAHAQWGNTHKLQQKIKSSVIGVLMDKI